MRKRDTGRGIHPDARIVWTTMLQRVAHPPGSCAEILTRISKCRVQETRDTAHLAKYLPLKMVENEKIPVWRKTQQSLPYPAVTHSGAPHALFIPARSNSRC